MPSTPPGGYRFVALHLPRIGIERIDIAHSRAGHAPPPTAILTGEGRGARVTLANAAAALLGVAPGLSRAEAIARAPGLSLHLPDPEADCAFVDRIADWCDRFARDVRVDPPDGIILGFAGDAAAAATVETRLGMIGLSARAAGAANPAAAMALARFQSAPGRDEAASIRRLPLAALGLEDGEAFAVAGLRTVGDLAALPRASIAACFGHETAQALARLLENDAASPRIPISSGLTLDHAFADPIDTPAALKALARLTREATARLADGGQGARRFIARFYEGEGRVDQLRIDAAVPGPRPASLAHAFARQAAALPIAKVDLIRLIVDRAAPLASPGLALAGGSAPTPPPRPRRARQTPAAANVPDLFGPAGRGG